MQDRVFWGMTAVEWGAIAAVTAAIVSLINAAIVAFVARFTFQYMQSTKKLVEAARTQSDAAIRQADASIKTLELMNIERRETESFQRAVFIHSIGAINSSLLRYRIMLLASAKPWHEQDCYLLPPEWDSCRAFISRRPPELLDEMLKIEIELNNLSGVIQGFIKAPDSLWLSTIQRRNETSARIEAMRMRIEAFNSNTLSVGSV